MSSRDTTEHNTHSWSLKSWLWVLLCVAAIYATVPLARRMQVLVYDTLGREFFTYAVLFIIAGALSALLYVFIYRLKIRNLSQYAWLLLCAGLFVYLTLDLDAHPEEAVHLLEYGLLSYFLFSALSHKIRDWTVYATAALLTLFFGIMDEFIQWLIPGRFWGLNDVKINMLAGVIFIAAIWKGVRPAWINRPVKRFSIAVLASALTANLLLLGLCFTNTPGVVSYYTSVSDSLSWLRSEETMTEYGYRHDDPDINHLYSRMTVDELKNFDRENGEDYGRAIARDHSSKDYDDLMEVYTPYTNPFLYEFLVHVSERDRKLKEYAEKENIESGAAAFAENLVLEKYFGNTLEHSGLAWTGNTQEMPEDIGPASLKDYSSRAGDIITSFSLKTVWIIIASVLTAVWIFASFCRQTAAAGSTSRG